MDPKPISKRLGMSGMRFYDEGTKEDGICKGCKQWQAQLSEEGYCLDPECRRTHNKDLIVFRWCTRE